jgi:DNA repair protein RecO (recombination protein O)
MIHKVRGIVFHAIRYAESSLIARVYTDKLGLQSYLVRGARKPRAKLRVSLFQPLNILEMEVYHKEKSSLQNIREARPARIFESIPFDVRKSSIAMFLGDVMTKSIREEEANPDLFRFLDQMITRLDQLESEVADFHLQFLVHLSKHLGFSPQGSYSQQAPFFDMEEGGFCGNQPGHSNFMAYPESEHFSRLAGQSPSEAIRLKIDREDRNSLLEHIIRYYQLHNPGLQNIRSHQVLREIFDQP